jgi:beta-glucanase (GH16 family)
MAGATTNWQTYTERPENVRIEDGMLVIEARKEEFVRRNYTSARLKTQGLHAWTYGRIEARMKLPYGNGIWPAFWMLGADIQQNPWPSSGEIDIMEYIGREPTRFTEPSTGRAIPVRRRSGPLQNPAGRLE